MPLAADIHESRWWLLIHYAVMAPSGHNTQPWRFHIAGPVAELLADRQRAIPAVDPHDRELTISCGAALLNLRVAMSHFRFRHSIEILPDPGRPDLIARLELLEHDDESEPEEALFHAIPERRTNRFPFEPDPVAPNTTVALEAAAAKEGAWIVPLRADADRKRIAALVAEGDRIQAADPEVRREISKWVRTNRSHARDGLRGHSFGHGAFESLIAPLYIRYVNWGDAQAQFDGELALAAPLLVVLGTDEDSPRAWVKAGQALGRLLLTAQSAGLSASFFNQPVEVPDLRRRLSACIGSSGYPQLCLRIGRGKSVLPSSRRPVEEVVTID